MDRRASQVNERIFLQCFQDESGPIQQRDIKSCNTGSRVKKNKVRENRQRTDTTGLEEASDNSKGTTIPAEKIPERRNSGKNVQCFLHYLPEYHKNNLLGSLPD